MRILILILLTFCCEVFTQEAIQDTNRAIEITQRHAAKNQKPTPLQIRIALANKRVKFLKALTVRSWQYNKSSSKYKGKYLKKDDKYVWITLENGKQKKMSIKALKKSDQKYIENIE